MRRKTEEFRKTHTCKILLAGVKGRGIPLYTLNHVGLYSFLINSKVLNTVLRLERKSQTSRSRWGRSSRHLGFLNLGFYVQYRGNPSRRLGSLALQRIFEEFTLEAFV